MSTTQNITLTDKSWVEVPETDCTITLDSSDNVFFFWTDGSTPTVDVRGHKIDFSRPVEIGASEKLWVHAQDGSAIVVYTVAT